MSLIESNARRRRLVSCKHRRRQQETNRKDAQIRRLGASTATHGSHITLAPKPAPHRRPPSARSSDPQTAGPWTVARHRRALAIAPAACGPCPDRPLRAATGPGCPQQGMGRPIGPDLCQAPLPQPPIRRRPGPPIPGFLHQRPGAPGTARHRNPPNQLNSAQLKILQCSRVPSTPNEGWAAKAWA